LKLRKIIIIEIAAITIALLLALLLIFYTPYLEASSQNTSIKMFNQREYSKGTATLTRGEKVSAFFNYSLYDPVILILDLTFQTWQTPGNLTIYINGKYCSSILVSQQEQQARLEIVTLSGSDWIKSPSIDSFVFGNQVMFNSDLKTGFEGTFNYQINIRGSR
jgi:hypothetical protein